MPIYVHNCRIITLIIYIFFKKSPQLAPDQGLQPADHPTDLRRRCEEEAQEIVRQSNTSTTGQPCVENENLTDLIARLTAVLLQIKVGCAERTSIKSLIPPLHARRVLKLPQEQRECIVPTNLQLCSLTIPGSSQAGLDVLSLLPQSKSVVILWLLQQAFLTSKVCAAPSDAGMRETTSLRKRLISPQFSSA